MHKVNYEFYKFYKYIPPLIKKVVHKYFNMLDLYPKVDFKIWSLAPKVTTWAIHAIEPT